MDQGEKGISSLKPYFSRLYTYPLTIPYAFYLKPVSLIVS